MVTRLHRCELPHYGVPRLAVAARVATARARSIRTSVGHNCSSLHGNQPATRPTRRGRTSLAVVTTIERVLFECGRQCGRGEDNGLGDHRLLHPCRPAHGREFTALGPPRGSFPGSGGGATGFVGATLLVARRSVRRPVGATH